MIYSCLKILKPPARALYLQRFAVFPFAFSLPSMFFIIIDFVVKPALFIASMHQSFFKFFYFISQAAYFTGNGIGDFIVQ